MADSHRTAMDLANTVCTVLNSRKLDCPANEHITELFESLYYASLCKEESNFVSAHIVYLDPKNPDPDPPSRIVKDRWTCVILEEPLIFNVSNIVKISMSTDPRTSSLAVFHDENNSLSIWGLIDQGNRYNDFVNFDSDSATKRPGVFQASILGIGHLVAYIGYEKVAELNCDNLIRSSYDILRGGAVRDILDIGLERHIEYIKKYSSDYLTEEYSSLDEHFGLGKHLSDQWIATICRILLRIQNIGHGGAILITQDKSYKWLNIKHGIDYSRLPSALQSYGESFIKREYASQIIHDVYLEDDSTDLPMDLYLDESVSGFELEESKSEIDGTIWFISLLSRVDGLILMTPQLEVKGFGVEITNPNTPKSVFMAGDRYGTGPKLKRIEHTHYGTRHRSMMRYCGSVPGSLGFVISQDGQVRAMTQVDGKLLIWENIRLQLLDFIKRKIKIKLKQKIKPKSKRKIKIKP